MSIFRLTDVSDDTRSTKAYWDERLERDWNTPTHGLFPGLTQKRLYDMDTRNWRVLASIAGNRSGLSCLECACGFGRYAPIVRKMGYEYFGIDLGDRNIAEARANFGRLGEFSVADMATFETEERFDLIFMVAAWSSIEQRSKEIIDHLKTLLSPMGQIAIFEESLYMVIG